MTSLTSIICPGCFGEQSDLVRDDLRGTGSRCPLCNGEGKVFQDDDGGLHLTRTVKVRTKAAMEFVTLNVDIGGVTEGTPHAFKRDPGDAVLDKIKDIVVLDVPPPSKIAAPLLSRNELFAAYVKKDLIREYVKEVNENKSIDYTAQVITRLGESEAVQLAQKVFGTMAPTKECVTCAGNGQIRNWMTMIVAPCPDCNGVGRVSPFVAKGIEVPGLDAVKKLVHEESLKNPFEGKRVNGLDAKREPMTCVVDLCPDCGWSQRRAAAATKLPCEHCKTREFYAAVQDECFLHPPVELLHVAAPMTLQDQHILVDNEGTLYVWRSPYGRAVHVENRQNEERIIGELETFRSENTALLVENAKLRRKLEALERKPVKK